MKRHIDAMELINRLTEIRDRKFEGARGPGTYQRKYDLCNKSRDRITADIKIILKMMEE